MHVSVVVPAYNEEQYIQGCLDSLLHQDEPADEIIVVNNNSTDNTESIVKKNKVRLVKEHMVGIIFARNRGFEEAQYEIIARTDADTRVPPSWIKRIKEDFSFGNIDGVSGPISYYDSPLKSPRYSKIFFKLTDRIFDHPILLGPNMAMTKDIWQKSKKLMCTDSTQVHEDIDMALHITEVGGTLSMDPDLIVQSSGRRIMHNPESFFVEYSQRLIKMKRSHKK